MILNRRYPNPVVVVYRETEVACRSLCLSFDTCIAIEYEDGATDDNCRIHLTGLYIRDELAVEVDNVRFLRLQAICVSEYFY